MKTLFLVAYLRWAGSRPLTFAERGLLWRLRSLLPARHREFGLWLLRHIVPSQRRGIGEVRLPSGWRVWFKGAWGSGTGRVDHQTALLERSSRRVVVAVTTFDNGSHSAGQATLRGVSVRLLRHLR